ncbi:MAG: HD domain-containing protein [Clostridia bacterium]|nr:HD domain-containing protein [Clostridia bacterium]
MNFTPTSNPSLVEGFCIIKSIEQKTTAKGAPFLDMTISDSSGEMNAKFWDVKELHVKFSVYDFVKVRGSVVSYNGSEQFRVDRIRHVTDADNVKIEDYVESTTLSGTVMLRQIENTVAAFKSEELKKLVTAVIDENREKLLYWPAALKLHHAVRGGLLFHTLSILRLAKGVADIYTFVNTDLLYSGIILHDIAKIDEIKVSESGIASDYTVKGNLLGHLVMGAINIDRTGRQLGISDETLTLIEHMLISHHGKPEFGAAQFPMFIEAEILSELDLLDARMEEMSSQLKQKNPGEFTARQWLLDNRKLYNHGLNGEFITNLDE